MALEILTVKAHLDDFGRVEPLQFSDVLNGNYVYGLSGFYFAFPKQSASGNPLATDDGYKIFNLGVSVEMTLTSPTTLVPRITAVMENGHALCADPGASYVLVTVLAYTGEDGRSAAALGNTGLLPSGKRVPAGGLPVLGGFQLHYPKQENNVMRVSASATISGGCVIPTASMADNKNQHVAEALADGGYLQGLLEQPGFVTQSHPHVQQGQRLSFDLGAGPLGACAVLLSGFTVTYPENKAWPIKDIFAGIPSPPVVLPSGTVWVQKACALMQSCWSGSMGPFQAENPLDVQDDEESYVDLLVVGVPK